MLKLTTIAKYSMKKKEKLLVKLRKPVRAREKDAVRNNLSKLVTAANLRTYLFYGTMTEEAQHTV